MKDRIFGASVLIVLAFTGVLLLESQSAASYPTYLLALLMLITIRDWGDVASIDLFWVLITLIGYLCLSSLWSQSSGIEEVFSILARGLLVLTFVVAFAETQQRGLVRRWLGLALAIAGTGACVLAMYMYLQDVDASRLVGMGQLDNEVVAGLVFAVVLILMLEVLITEPSIGWKMIAILSSVCLSAAIYLTDSRNAWISAVLGSLVFLFSHLVKDRERFVIAVSAMTVVLGTLVITLALGEESRDLLLPRGDSFRIDIWQVAWQRIQEADPIFGLGILTPDTIAVGGIEFDHPHSMYLSLIYQGGLVALLLFLVLLVMSIRTLLRNYELSDAKVAFGLLGVALPSYLLDGHELIDKVGETWFLFWLPVAIALGLAWRRIAERSDLP